MHTLQVLDSESVTQRLIPSLSATVRITCKLCRWALVRPREQIVAHEGRCAVVRTQTLET